MTRIPYEELDYGDDGLYYYRGVPFTGVAIYLEGGGWIQAEEEYQEGLLWGQKREWHQPGKLEREAQCVRGARHGLCREWDGDGHLIAEEAYEYGVRESGKRWDSDGNLVEEFHINEADPAYQILRGARDADQRTE